MVSTLDTVRSPLQPKIRGDYCLTPCKPDATSSVTSQEFGYLTVITEPENAEVCYLVEGEWENWNCGQQMALPIGKLVDIKVTAKNHNVYTTTTTLEAPEQQLAVNLTRKDRRGYKIAGAIAAIVVSGILVSNRNKNNSEPGSEDGYQITLTLPSQ